MARWPDGPSCGDIGRETFPLASEKEATLRDRAAAGVPGHSNDPSRSANGPETPGLDMLDRNVVLVLRTRQERTERRLRHKKEANPPPMEPPALLLNNNHLYIDLNMNFSEDRNKQEAARAAKKSSSNNAANLGVSEKREHLYKILVIGELGAGKTSIIKRYVHQFFSQHYRATIGVDFALKVLNWDPHTIIRLQLWDIAGQERFGNMTRVYYKEAVGAFIVFDVTRSATLDAVVKWKQDLDSKVQLPDGSPIPCVLLANKCDQQKEGLVNSPAKMDEYCKEKNFSGWFETSAKENINIEEAARFLVNKILQNDQIIRDNGVQEQTDNERFALSQSPTSSKKFCSC